VIFGFGSKILKDALFPVPLHVIPVVNKAMTNRIMQTVSLRVGDRFVANEEVKIFDSTLGCKVSRLGGYWRSSASPGRSSMFSGGDSSGEDTRSSR